MEEQRLITLENISKAYDGVTVLSNINLYIRKKEFVTLLGPSGCGKTTTLRIWQDDEDAIMFFVARMLAVYIQASGAKL